MSNWGNALVPALMEGAGVFLVAAIGGDLMFSGELEAAGLATALVPALAFALVTTVYRTLVPGIGATRGFARRSVLARLGHEAPSTSS